VVKVQRFIAGLMRILEGDPKEIEAQYSRLSDLTLSYGGRIYGSQHSVSDDRHYLAVSFEIPTSSLTEYIKEEAQPKQEVSKI